MTTRIAVARALVGLGLMTDREWKKLTPDERHEAQSERGLTPQLRGYEGWRVQVTTKDLGTYRFIVGRSTGWEPCHLEVSRRNSKGGIPARMYYDTVKPIERVR